MPQWIDPNTITGPPAEGKKYFKRANVENEIWTEIEKGCHVLFLAPRRVGKSSIVMNMAKQPRRHYHSIFENIQSEDTSQAFYKRLYTLTIRLLSGIDTASAIFKKYIGSRGIKKIGPDGGIEFITKGVDYREEFYDLLEQIKVQKEQIVLILDEFPDVIKQIAEKESKEAAKSLLEDLRELRQSQQFRSKFTLILLGSVGLHHIVKQIDGRTDKINDLQIINLEGLDDQEINQFYDHMFDGVTMQVSKDVRSYLSLRIGRIPYYIQLLVENANSKLRNSNTNELTEDLIDECFDELIKENERFQDWKSRITKYFPDKGNFLIKVLSVCAINDSISIQEIFDLAKNTDFEDQYFELTEDILIKDGYLYEVSNHTYAFNSPLLQAWWARRHPKF